MRVKIAFIVALMLLCSVPVFTAQVPVPEKTMAEKSLAQLSQTRQSKDFQFILFGTTRPEVSLHIPKEFSDAIEDSNTWNPAFIVALGDMIVGYSRIELLTREWDCQIDVASRIQSPFMPVVGDHDVFGDESSDVYIKRVAPLYYSFDYGGSHFICLDNVEKMSTVINYVKISPAAISDIQLAWLKKDLGAHKKSRNIFIFMHKVVWDKKRYPDSNWQIIHDILKNYPVRAVFAGDSWGCIRYPTLDGISYASVGPTDKVDYEDLNFCCFPQYLLVDVKVKEVSWKIIRSGSVKPDNFLTSDRSQSLYEETENMRKRITVEPEFDLCVDNPFPKEFVINIDNTGGSAGIPLNIDWRMPNEKWRIEPESTTVNVAPGNKTRMVFDVSLSDKRYITSTCHRGAPMALIEFPSSDGKRTLLLDMEPKVSYAPHLCPHASSVAIDGDLSDWTGTSGYIYAGEHGSGDFDPDNLYINTRQMWDEKYLYLASEVWDNDYRTDGSDAFYFRAGKVWLWILGDTHQALDGDNNFKPFDGIQVGFSDRTGHAVYEIAIPFSLTGWEIPKPGDTKTLRFQPYDQDGEGPRDWYNGGWPIVFK